MGIANLRVHQRHASVVTTCRVSSVWVCRLDRVLESCVACTQLCSLRHKLSRSIPVCLIGCRPGDSSPTRISAVSEIWEGYVQSS